MMEQFSEPQTAELRGLHKQAERQIIYMVSHLLMQIPELLLVDVWNNSQNHKRRNYVDFTNKRNDKLSIGCLIY